VTADAGRGTERNDGGAPAAPSLRATLQRGSIWAFTNFGGSQVLRFFGHLVLTRLLFPEAFGLMSIVTAVLLGLQLFSDVGIRPSIIQSHRGDDPDFLNTAWTIQIMRGVVLWLVACALASPCAGFYGEPELARILPVAGLGALVSGFDSTRSHSLYRKLDLKRSSLLHLGSRAFGLVLMIAWAWIVPTIWALVAGGLAGNLVWLVLSHTALPGLRNRLRWDRSALALLVRFGRWIFFSTMLTFLVTQSDRLVFGKLIPLALLGVYGVGAALASMPAEGLGHLSSNVLFPVFSRMHNADRDLRDAFRRVRLPILVLAGWMVAGLAAGGSVIVRILYDARYAEAGWVVQLLALGSWFTVLQSTNGSVLLARGQAHWNVVINGGKLVGMLVSIPAGYALAGFPGAVAGLVLSDVVRYVVSAYAANTVDLRGWPQDLRLSAWLGVSAVAAWFLAERLLGAGCSSVTASCAVFASVTLLWTPPAIVSLRGARPRT
jgi:O-antigen/teichoic acid export membrane protein